MCKYCEKYLREDYKYETKYLSERKEIKITNMSIRVFKRLLIQVKMYMMTIIYLHVAAFTNINVFLLL